MVNPYDPCVANKDVGDGKQMTVIWHVDDLMASCVVNFKLTKLSWDSRRAVSQLCCST